MFIQVHCPSLLKNNGIKINTDKTQFIHTIAFNQNKQRTHSNKVTPDKFPPRHKPVDIARQPQYKSSNFISGSLLSSGRKASLG